MDSYEIEGTELDAEVLGMAVACPVKFLAGDVVSLEVAAAVLGAPDSAAAETWCRGHGVRTRDG